jgi:hypothetical protein
MNRCALSGVAVGIGVALAYTLGIRRWFLTWGARAEELKAALPGDEIVLGPRTACTRAIAIAADSDDVWPWLAQLGQGRGGWYSHDWLENLFGYDIHNVDRVVPRTRRKRASSQVSPSAGGSRARSTSASGRACNRPRIVGAVLTAAVRFRDSFWFVGERETSYSGVGAARRTSPRLLSGVAATTL